MRLTYSSLKKIHFRNIGKAGQFADTNLLEDFQFSLGQRYQLILASLANWLNSQTKTSSTVAAQQYYSYPPGIIGMEGTIVTIGSFQIPVTTIYSQEIWNYLNAIPIQPSSFPQFVFPRQNDFGIWPIPQDAYTLTINAFMRDRNLLIEDYTDGTVAVTAGSATITGTGTVWTTAMVGRWFSVTDPLVPGQGYWYRVKSFSGATSLVLDNFFAGSTASGAIYVIGESPELPEEGHILLPDGTTSDFYAGMRNTPEKATWWDNKFWTGSGKNDSRDFGDENIRAGLVGLMNRYQGRDNETIIRRQPRVYGAGSRAFAGTIS